MMKICLTILSAFVTQCLGNTGHFYLSYKTGNEFKIIRSGSPPDTVGLEWTARAYYNNSINSTGWDVLEIITNPELSDYDQAYQAGWIEGFLTQKQILYHWYNTQRDFCTKIPTTCAKIKSYLLENFDWIESNLNKTDDPYWHQVNLYYRQIIGLYNGYQDAVAEGGPQLAQGDILLMNYVTDIMTLTDSLATVSERNLIKQSGHCSVLIKLLPGFTDVIFGHNAWITYNFMNRIIKRYNFSYHWSLNSTKLIPGQSQAFSSYAGVITSIDDFYIINSGLVVTETTNYIYDNDIYKYNKPKGQVLESVRSVVANRLAIDTQSWSHYFSLMNSGTYNNQWMVIDLKKFRPGIEPEKGFLRVLEQMPGKIESHDQTNHIKAHSYWASYNVPFYESIYNYSGYNRKEKEFGSFYSYKNCARGKIFQREQNTVVDLNSMIRAIRFNHYETDPYSTCKNCTPEQNACLAVASRCDLNLKNGTYSLQDIEFQLYGAIDAKIGSYSMFKKGEMVSIGGPSRSGGYLPPFQWSSAQEKNMSHIGQPDLWDFDPITTSWIQPYLEADPEEKVITVFKMTIPSKDN